jgi:hypothetical protein
LDGSETERGDDKLGRKSITLGRGSALGTRLRALHWERALPFQTRQWLRPWNPLKGAALKNPAGGEPPDLIGTMLRIVPIYGI